MEVIPAKVKFEGAEKQLVQQYLTDNINGFSNHRWHKMYAKTNGHFRVSEESTITDDGKYDIYKSVWFPHHESSDSATGFRLDDLKSYFVKCGLYNGKVYQVT